MRCFGRVVPFGFWALLMWAVALTGCSSVEGLRNAPGLAVDAPVWTGRMSLKVTGVSEANWFANFELVGNPDHGELVLSSAFGQRLAQVVWAPHHASLTRGSETQVFDDLHVLLSQIMPAPLPVHRLFDWLHGRNTTDPTWVADLTQLQHGRLRAFRRGVLPEADLTLVWETANN